MRPIWEAPGEFGRPRSRATRMGMHSSEAAPVRLTFPQSVLFKPRWEVTMTPSSQSLMQRETRFYSPLITAEAAPSPRLALAIDSAREHLLERPDQFRRFPSAERASIAQFRRPDWVARALLSAVGSPYAHRDSSRWRNSFGGPVRRGRLLRAWSVRADYGLAGRRLQLYRL